MKIIREANEIISKIWNTEKIERTNYRLLTYTLTADVKDGTLLHNTVTGELLFLDAEEAQHLSSLPCDYAPWMDSLIQKNFLVPEGYEDKKTVDSLRVVCRQVERKKEIDSYVILPTTACNARCFYCYEAGMVHSTMSDEIADKTVNFIAAHHGGKNIHICWYGGEPLVGVRQIDRICRGLMEKGIAFHSEMISNAYLFDEETIKRAREQWKLHEIQVTLDGSEKVYNQVKAFVHPCENPYQRVLKNIELLRKNGISVSIRLNLGMHNADDLFSLVRELGEYFEDKTNLRIYSALLFEDCGGTPLHLTTDEDKLLIPKQKELSELIASLGLSRSNARLPKLNTTVCLADNDASITVLPDGRLTKCQYRLERRIAGDLEHGITNRAEGVTALKETVYAPHCYTCPLYPSCIKLKLCEFNKPCRKAEMPSRIRNTEKAMKFIYEKEKNDNEDEV